MIARMYGGMRGRTEYLTANKSAFVMRGDPDATKNIIAGLNFTQNFMSGCVSFHEADAPTEAQQEAVIEKFSAHLGRGRNVNELWVRHEDKGRVELHFVIPEVDLDTGKKFQPWIAKIDKKRIDALVQGFNASHGWKSGHDASARIERDSASKLRLPKERRELLTVLDGHMKNEWAAGRLPDRAAVVRELEGLGLKITRDSKESLSVEIDGKSARLKGIFYERNYDSRKIDADLEREVSRTGPTGRGASQEHFSAAERYLEQRIEGDADRYKITQAERVDLGRDRTHGSVGQPVGGVVLEADEDAEERNSIAGRMEMGRQAGTCARPNAKDDAVPNSRRPPAATNQINERYREIVTRLHRATIERVEKSKRAARIALERYRSYAESLHRAAGFGVGRPQEFGRKAYRIGKLSQQLESAAGRIDDLIERIERRGLSM